MNLSSIASVPALAAPPPRNLEGSGLATPTPPGTGAASGAAASQGSVALQAARPSQQATPPTATEAPAQADIDQALKEVREAIAPVAQNLQFSLDEESGRTVIKIVDSSTDEVIRQIPSEEILAIAKALDKLQGVLIKQEV